MRLSQENKIENYKVFSWKKPDWIGEISGIACPGEHQQGWENLLTVNRQVRSVGELGLFWKTERTTLTFLNLHDSCTYLSEPRGGLGMERVCVSVELFLLMPSSVAQSCVVLVATQMLGTNCGSTQYQDRTGLTALTGQVGSQGWREVLYCRSQVCRDLGYRTEDQHLKPNRTLNHTYETICITWHPMAVVAKRQWCRYTSNSILSLINSGWVSPFSSKAKTHNFEDFDSEELTWH